MPSDHLDPLLSVGNRRASQESRCAGVSSWEFDAEGWRAPRTLRRTSCPVAFRSSAQNWGSSCRHHQVWGTLGATGRTEKEGGSQR